MRVVFLSLCAAGLLLLASTGAFADEVVYQNADLGDNATVIKSSSDSLTVRFAVPEVKAVDQFYADFGMGAAFRVPGADLEKQVGAPDVPMIRRGIQIPNTGDVVLEIVGKQTEEIGKWDVVPSQGPISSCVGAAPYSYDAQVYNTDAFFPAVPARIDSIQILRDLRVARVRYYPVSVNPVSGVVQLTTSVDVKFTFTKTPGKNELKRKSKTLTKEYLPFYKDLVNFNPAALKQVDSGTVPSYIFLGSDETLAAVSDLIDWKKKKGFEVHEVTTAETGTDSGSIDAWIENAFNTWDNPPLYILIVGDQTTVDTPWVTKESDHQYAVIGSGNEASIGIGRINQQNGDMGKLTYQAWKALMHETDPYVEGNFFENAISWGCQDLGGHNTAARWQGILEEGDMTVDLQQEGITASKGAELAADFNDPGASLFGMKGHGTPTAWYSASFDVSTIQNSLNNGRKLTFINSIGCNNSQFTDYYSFAEAFMAEGSIESPKGALGLLSWTEVAYMDAEIVIQALWQAMFNENLWHVALGMNYGKTLISEQSDIDHGMIWGDPELAPYTVNNPPQLDVAHGAVSAGDFTITVTAEDSPIEGALVAVVSQDDLTNLGAGYTNSAGELTLTLGEVTGDVFITGTYHNTLPYLGEGTSGSDDDDDDDDTDTGDDDDDDTGDDDDDTGDDDDDDDDDDNDDDDNDDDNNDDDNNDDNDDDNDDNDDDNNDNNDDDNNDDDDDDDISNGDDSGSSDSGCSFTQSTATTGIIQMVSSLL